MGLDMYLHCNSKDLAKKMNDTRGIREEYEKRWRKYLRKNGIVVYWRKANAIHAWLVRNAQDNVDDCQEHEVTIEQLEELKDICDEILGSCELVPGKVSNDKRMNDDGEWEEIVEDGLVMTNGEYAKTLLPTQEGFFFGSTSYDQWYYDDVAYTAEKLGKLLGMLETDEYGNAHLKGDDTWIVRFSYRSSW